MNKMNRPGTGLRRAALAVGLAVSGVLISHVTAQEAVSRPTAVPLAATAPGVTGATSAAPAPNTLPSQPQTAPPNEATAERIIVTGSNIPTAEEVGPNPVLNFNRETITKSGERNTEEFLRN